MQAGTEDVRGDEWQRAAQGERIESAGRLTVRVDGKQLAMFLHEGRVHACNNRCPHEGYPLVEGSIHGDGVLTCHRHNWKFDLATGANPYGRDALRIYPAKVEAGAVWVDARDPPAELRIARAWKQLDDAMTDHDAPRIARELARLGKAGATPERALTAVVLRSHERFRYGRTHAYGAAERPGCGCAIHSAMKRSAWPARPRFSATSRTTRCANRCLLSVPDTGPGTRPNSKRRSRRKTSRWRSLF